MLANPVRRRRRSGRFVRAFRRNPTRRRTTSAAIRRKISLAVKAANRRRAGGGGRVSSRRAVVRTARRRSVRRFRSAGPVIIRRSVRRSPVRAFRRRSSRRRGGLMSGGTSIKALFDKQTLTVAASAVGGQFITRWVLQNFADKLPFIKNTDGSVNQYGLIGYQLGVPTAAAFVVRRWNPTVAKGLMLGGMISAINTAINLMQGLSLGAPSASGASAYIDSPVGADPALNPPSYDAVNAFSGVYDPVPAFGGDAWSRH